MYGNSDSPSHLLATKNITFSKQIMAYQPDSSRWATVTRAWQEELKLHEFVLNESTLGTSEENTTRSARIRFWFNKGCGVSNLPSPSRRHPDVDKILYPLTTCYSAKEEMDYSKWVHMRIRFVPACVKKPVRYVPPYLSSLIRIWGSRDLIGHSALSRSKRVLPWQQVVPREDEKSSYVGLLPRARARRPDGGGNRKFCNPFRKQRSPTRHRKRSRGILDIAIWSKTH